VAEACGEHLLDVRLSPVHVVVHEQSHKDICFEHDRPISSFDQLAEKFVAQQRKYLDSVGRLAEGEQSRHLG